MFSEDQRMPLVRRSAVPLEALTEKTPQPAQQNVQPQVEVKAKQEPVEFEVIHEITTILFYIGMSFLIWGACAVMQLHVGTDPHKVLLFHAIIAPFNLFFQFRSFISHVIVYRDHVECRSMLNTCVSRFPFTTIAGVRSPASLPCFVVVATYPTASKGAVLMETESGLMEFNLKKDADFLRHLIRQDVVVETMRRLTPEEALSRGIVVEAKQNATEV